MALRGHNRGLLCLVFLLFASISAFEFNGGVGKTELNRWNIPAARFETIRSRDLAPDRPGKTPEEKAGVAAANALRQCFTERHVFKDAARAWDVLLAVSASRSPHALMLAKKFAYSIRDVLKEFWFVTLIDAKREENTSQFAYFQRHCGLVFDKDNVCNVELFREAAEKCPGGDTNEEPDVLCKEFFTKVSKLILVDVFAHDPHTHGAVAGAVGDDPDVIFETFQEGNIRELLTLSFLKESKLAPAFVYLLNNFPKNSERLNVFNRLAPHGGFMAAKLNYDAIEETCVADGCSPYEKGLNRIVYAQTSNYWVYRNNVAGFEREQRSREQSASIAPVTESELEFLSTELSRRERAFIARTPGYKDDGGTLMMPWVTGSQKWMVQPDSDYGRASMSSMLNAVAGPSGTTARTFLTAKFLGFTEDEMLVLRLALVGYLVPWQHSLLEVFLGAAEFVGYTDVDPARIHESLIPEGFSWSFKNEPYTLTRENFMDHVKSIGIMMKEKEPPRLNVDELFLYGQGPLVYYRLVHTMKIKSPNDPRMLLYFFHDKLPKEFLRDEFSKLVINECAMGIMYGTTATDDDMTYVKEYSQCYVLNNMIHDQFPKRDERGFKLDAVWIANVCGHTSLNPECSIIFDSSRAAKRYVSALNVHEQTGRDALIKHGALPHCVPNFRHIPDTFKPSIHLKEISEGSHTAYYFEDSSDDEKYGWIDISIHSLPPRVDMRILESEKMGGYGDLQQLWQKQWKMPSYIKSMNKGKRILNRYNLSKHAELIGAGPLVVTSPSEVAELKTRGLKRKTVSSQIALDDDVNRMVEKIRRRNDFD